LQLSTPQHFQHMTPLIADKTMHRKLGTTIKQQHLKHKPTQIYT